MNTTALILVALAGLVFLAVGIWIGRQMASGLLASQESRLKTAWDVERQRQQQDLQNANQQVALARQENQQLQNTLQAEKQAHQDAGVVLEQLRATVADSSARLSAAQAGESGLNTRLAERQLQLETQSRQLADVHEQRRIDQALIESQKVELGRAQEQKERLDRLVVDLQTKESELSALRQSANDASSRIAELETATRKDDSLIAERNQQIDKMQLSFGELETRLEQATQTIKNQNAQLGHAQAEKQQLEQLQLTLTSRDQRIAGLQAELQTSLSLVRELETARQKDTENMAEKLALLESNKLQLKQEFENLAHQIFESKQQHFTQQSQQGLDTLLKPFKEQLESFRKRVDEVHTNTVEGQTSMKVELDKLRELNTRINDEAANLTQALKGDKKLQGTWGEQKVDLLLEQAGLRKDFEYKKEENFKDEDGQNRRPDFVVQLPEGKHIIIDSKMSLVAYTQYVAAETDAERSLALLSHLKALREHVNSLSQRKYHTLIGMHSPDFVFLFVGVEPAYILAAERDPSLFQEAYEKGIAIVTATTLLPVLRVVSNLWVIQRQNQTTRELAEQASRVYDKLRVFVDKMEKVGDAIDKAQITYRDSFNTLKDGQGSLTKTVHKFVDLGVKVSRQLPATVLVEDLPELAALPDTSL